MSAPIIIIRGGDAVTRNRVFHSVRAACSTYAVNNVLTPSPDMTPSVTIRGGDAAERNSLYDRIARGCVKDRIISVNIYREKEAQPDPDGETLHDQGVRFEPDAPQPVNDGDLMTRLGMDAQKWAVEFDQRFHNATVTLAPISPSNMFVDKADLIGWFANAIMAGYDRGREQGEKETREIWAQSAWSSLKARMAAEQPVTPCSVVIEFGPDIETPHDTMPDWLPFGTFVKFANHFKDWGNKPDHAVPAWAWEYIPAIRLPKGHPLYATKPWDAEQGDFTRPIPDDLMSSLTRGVSSDPTSVTWIDEAAEIPQAYVDSFKGTTVKKMATLLIPRIDNDGHDLSAEHAALQVELIGLFGGYTATAATGGWRDGLTIYRDELTRYDVAVKAFDTTVERDLQRVAERMARACHQECIMLVLPDGQAICVDAAGGVR